MKLKTHKGISKRFKLSASGKVRFHHAGKSHILTSKSKKRKRHLRRAGTLNIDEIKKIRRGMSNA
jgi:large subunit ribosomal protein L35